MARRIEALIGSIESLRSTVAAMARSQAEMGQRVDVHLESLPTNTAELHAASQRHDALLEALVKESK